jgi:Spy/CpxP family protein refolding chaperone
MIRNRSLWAVLPIAWMVGCQANVSDGTATATTATPASPVAAQPTPVVAATVATNAHQGFGPHGGPVTAFLHAAHGLTLTASQQGSLDTLEATLRADDDAIHTAMKAFHADLSAGVKAGALDTTKLGTESAAVDRAMADHRAKEAAALVSLHTLLDPTQRTALVTAVRAKQAEHEARMESWKAKDEGSAQDWQKKRLDKLTVDLALDAVQQQQVAAILAQAKDPSHAAGRESHRDEMRQHNEALLTAFAGDTFDTSQAEPRVQPGKTGHQPMTGHMVSFVSQILPILHPDQRDKLASSMESRSRGPGGPLGDIVEPAAGE